MTAPEHFAADPLGCAIAGAAFVTYARLGFPAHSCGIGAEAVSRRVMAALAEVVNDDGKVEDTPAGEAVRLAILEHVSTLGKPVEGEPGIPPAFLKRLEAGLLINVGRALVIAAENAPEQEEVAGATKH